MQCLSKLFHGRLWAGRDLWLSPPAVVTQIMGSPGEGSPLVLSLAQGQGAPGCCMGSSSPQPHSCDVPLGMVELVMVKDEPRRPLPSSAKNERRERDSVGRRVGMPARVGASSLGTSGLRVKAAAAPLLRERRVENQETTPSTPKFT